MHERLFRWRCWFEDRFPDRRQRVAAAVLAPLTLICAVWVLVFTIGALVPGRTGPQVTPLIRHAQDLTRKLHESTPYASVTVLPHIDYPDRLRVSGAVPGPADVETLKSRLSELDPTAQFVVEVRTGE